MITVTSKINDAYSATVYPEVIYGGGNGYFFHYSEEGGKAIDPYKVPLNIRNELIPQIEIAWKGEQ